MAGKLTACRPRCSPGGTASDAALGRGGKRGTRDGHSWRWKRRTGSTCRDTDRWEFCQRVRGEGVRAALYGAPWPWTVRAHGAGGDSTRGGRDEQGNAAAEAPRTRGRGGGGSRQRPRRRGGRAAEAERRGRGSVCAAPATVSQAGPRSRHARMVPHAAPADGTHLSLPPPRSPPLLRWVCRHPRGLGLSRRPHVPSPGPCSPWRLL